MSHHGAEYHNQSGRDSDPRGRDSDPHGSHSQERHRSGSSGRNATKHVNGRNQDHHDHRGQEYQGQRGQEYHGQRGQGNHGQRGQEYPGQKEQERFANHDQKGQNYPGQYRGNQRGGNWNRGQPQSYRGNPNREYGRGRGSYNNDQQYNNSYSQGVQYPLPAGQQGYYGPSGGQQYVQSAQGPYGQGDRGQYNQRRQQTEGYGFRQQRSRDGDRLVTLSKSLSYLLRHGANRNKMNLLPGGFLYVKEILSLPQFRGASVQDVETVVKNNDKKRFALKMDIESNCLMIRANQGHTIEVDDLELTPITNPEEIPNVIHGTYYQAWEAIKYEGLKRFDRNHIHFAAGLPDEDGVISGMRKSCEVMIYIDAEKAIKGGIPFFRSANNVILSPGDAKGVIGPCFFKHAVNRKPFHKLEFDPDVDYRSPKKMKVDGEGGAQASTSQKKRKNKNKKKKNQETSEQETSTAGTKEDDSEGDDNLPADEGGDNLPADEGGDNLPADEGGDNLPADEGGDNLPEENGDNVPADEGGDNLPEKNGDNVPADEGDDNLPADEGDDNLPADEEQNLSGGEACSVVETETSTVDGEGGAEASTSPKKKKKKKKRKNKKDQETTSEQEASTAGTKEDDGEGGDDLPAEEGGDDALPDDESADDVLPDDEACSAVETETSSTANKLDTNTDTEKENNLPDDDGASALKNTGNGPDRTGSKNRNKKKTLSAKQKAMAFEIEEYTPPEWTFENAGAEDQNPTPGDEKKKDKKGKGQQKNDVPPAADDKRSKKKGKGQQDPSEIAMKQNMAATSSHDGRDVKESSPDEPAEDDDDGDDAGGEDDGKNESSRQPRKNKKKNKKKNK